MSKKLLIVISIISILAFNLSAFGETVSALLEEGIYAEETKGDLDEAILIYHKIIDENTGNSADIAEAYYRLGTCYMKAGNDAKAIVTFKKLLTGFREHEEIASNARAQLLKLDALEGEGQKNRPLKLGPVPWEAGETCWYTIKTPAGAVAGSIIMSIRDITADGNEMWQIESYTAAPIDDSQTFDSVDILKKDFTPVSSIFKSNSPTMNDTARTKYKKGNIRFTAEKKNKTDNKDIPIEGVVYSSRQQLHLIRLLPITENYNCSISLFMEPVGSLGSLPIKATARETVTVPAGTFDCYRLEHGFNQALNSNINAKTWVSSDDKKYIVKIEVLGQTIELEKVARLTTDEPREFMDDKTGLSMSAPKGWNFVESTVLTPVPFKILLQILAPEIKAAPAFVIVSHAGFHKNIQDLPETTMETLKKTFRNFTLRPESKVYGEIDGLPSLTYIADYDKEDKHMIEYRAYILDKQELGSFCLRTDKETFEEIKADVDSIIQSIKWDRK